VNDIDIQNEQLLRAYQLCFGSPAGQAVLVDLAPFCRAAETCVVRGDRDATLVLEGRREVWLRIQQFARLSEEDILELRMGRAKPQEAT
jgi:hypothetical protein